MLQIRHRFNEYLAQYAGHIGYSVRPCERRKGYATAMLCAALPHAKALGLSRVLITCNADNEASRRVIVACGGCYDGTRFDPEEQKDIERYWISL